MNAEKRQKLVLLANFSQKKILKIWSFGLKLTAKIINFGKNVKFIKVNQKVYLFRNSSFLCWETLIMRSTTSQILNMPNIEHCFQFSFNVALSRAPSSLLFFSFDTELDNLVRLNDTKRDLIAIICGLFTTIILTEIVLELKRVPSDLSFTLLLRLL